MSVDLTFVDAALERHGGAPESVIPILQSLQDHYGYLPAEALLRVCERSQIRAAAISGVSTFYDMFRHAPAGQFIVQVCHGTACHVAGAERVEDALRRHLRIPTGQNTDPDGRFTIEQVACLGCCTLAPVQRIAEQTIGYSTAERVPADIAEFLATHKGNGSSRPELSSLLTHGAHAEIKVCLDSCCLAKGTDRVFEALRRGVVEGGLNASVKRVGCVAACYRTPVIEVARRGGPGLTYSGLAADTAEDLLQRHFPRRGLARRMSSLWNTAVDTLLTDGDGRNGREGRAEAEGESRPFFERQVHIAMEHYGRLDPLDLDECLAHDGFAALAKCLGVAPPAPTGASSAAPAEPLTPEELIRTIEDSGLRGRGGAGFPTGRKWRVVRDRPLLAQPSPPASASDLSPLSPPIPPAPPATKYVICNGDEGDPGAFMDRMILESFPYRVIEGLAIAAVAVGAHEAIFYIRHEYPHALRRVRAALAECERRGLLGERLLGSHYALRFSIREGAGAFVCGEETALIASIEGRRGMPRLRPPFPAESGLWGQPTLINNVETLALVPWIVRHGAAQFARIGTHTSKGTKVFALAGKVRRAGLIEIPMGTTLRQIVEDIGGGVGDGRRFKAVQIGGPSGGCVPARLADTPVDYESLRDIGAIMGSGGLVVLDDTACMVDIARYFLQFTQNQSCGKCLFCRIGTKRMLELLQLLCAGTATRQHLLELEDLAHQVTQASLCGLGKTAPNPVLTTLRYFRDEYEAHLEGRCPAGKCTALIRYEIGPKCTGCTICAQRCPVEAIPVTPYARHTIDQELCTRCDSCRQVCPNGAVEVR